MCEKTKKDGKRLEILDLDILVAKTKALFSFAVTVKLITAFVFACADCWFSHVAAHLIFRCFECTVTIKSLRVSDWVKRCLS